MSDANARNMLPRELTTTRIVIHRYKMAQLITGLYDGYRDLMDNKSDPRVSDWPLMSSPVPTLLLCATYAYCSRRVGPRLMANRKPFNLREVLIVYNLLQTVFSAWIFYEYLQSGWWNDYNFKCQPVDYSNNPKALRMAATCWWYYFSKFTEFFDTLFFILRKKNNHVSTLHVIHHGVMPFSVWMGLKFAPGGHSTFFALLNTFVHIVMYFYYMVAAMGPRYQKYIWWKKYLTSFQMIQFVAIFSHQLQLLFRDCDYPKSFMIWIAMHGFLFLFLFSDFYKVNYSKLPKNDSNKGACMPVMEDDKLANLANGYKHQNGVPYTHTNNCVSANYVTAKDEPGDAYYSNGVDNGFVKDIRLNGLTHRDRGQKDQ